MVRSWIVTTLWVLCVCGVGYSKTSKIEKLLNSDWKLEFAQKKGNYISPDHDDMVVSFNKDHSFKFSSESKVLLAGSWDYQESEHEILLEESRNNTRFDLDLEVINKDHIAMEDPNDPDVIIYLTKMEPGEFEGLNHLEIILCKTWYLAETTIKENEGSLLEFHKDKTFNIYTGASRYDYGGSWWVDSDNMKIYVKDRYEKEANELEILEIHPHKLMVRNVNNDQVKTFYNDELIPKTSKGNLKKIGAIFLPVLLFLLIP